jgi:hypothetical protein
VHDLHMHSPGNTNMSSSGKSSPCVIGENSGAIRDKTVAVGPYFMCPQLATGLNPRLIRPTSD